MSLCSKCGWESDGLPHACVEDSAAAPYEDTDHKISRLEYMVEILEMQAVDLRRELAEVKEANIELGADLAWQKQYALRWEKAATVAMKELAAERAEGEEQARLLGISGSREAKLLAQVEALKVDAERLNFIEKKWATIYASALDGKVSHWVFVDETATSKGARKGILGKTLRECLDAARGEK